MARLVRLVLRMKPNNGPLQVVIRPTAKGERQEFSSKYLLKKACLEEAGCQFSQANDTLLLQPTITQWFGEIGTNRPAFKQVLQGKFNKETNNLYVEKLFQAFKQPEQVSEVAP